MSGECERSALCRDERSLSTVELSGLESLPLSATALEVTNTGRMCGNHVEYYSCYMVTTIIIADYNNAIL